MEIISPFALYLWTRLDTLCVFLGLATFTSLLVILLPLLAYFMGDSEEAKKFLGRKTPYVTFAILMLLTVAVPSQKDFAMIYVIPKLANSETLQREASEVYTMGKDALRQALGVSEEAGE